MANLEKSFMVVSLGIKRGPEESYSMIYHAETDEHRSSSFQIPTNLRKTSSKEFMVAKKFASLVILGVPLA